MTCFYWLQRLLGANCSRKEEAKYHPLTRFTLMALARKNCIRCWYKSFSCQGKFTLSDANESDADAKPELVPMDSIESGADSSNPRLKNFALESHADSIKSKTASFSLEKKHLHQHLMHWNQSMDFFVLRSLVAPCKENVLFLLAWWHPHDLLKF